MHSQRLPVVVGESVTISRDCFDGVTEYYKAVKKYLDKVVYEEKKKYEIHPPW
jgi:hypothetical protein